MNKRILLTGASGMIGNLVLRHCLDSANVREVISIVRKPGSITHPKLKEVVHTDFLNYGAVTSAFSGVDTAYFCIGVYTGAVPDAEFRKITVDYTVAFADALKAGSPQATLCFLSGDGADRNEKSRLPFARYKGMAENHLLRCGFGQLCIFRPGYIYPVEKRTEPNLAYRAMRALYPLIRHFGNGFSITSTDLAKAMFVAGLHGAPKQTLENTDIIAFAQQLS